MRRQRYIPSSSYPTSTQGTEDTELTLTREGDYIGSTDDNVEEINIFEGQFNRITFEQVYTKTFKCTYQLQLYPFDTQVRTILKKSSISSIIVHYHSFNPLVSLILSILISKMLILSNNSPADISEDIFFDLLVIFYGKLIY